MKKKVVLFGTGKIYERNISRIEKNVDVIALLDNDENKWGTDINGIKVFAPETVQELEYDYVFILCSKVLDVRRQLCSLGVPEEEIYDLSRNELIFEKRPIQHFPATNKKTDFIQKVLIISHALTSTGAQNVLFSAVDMMIKMGYSVTVLSLEDGIQRESYLQLGADVIVSGDILSHEADWKELVEWADLVWVNTVWLFHYAYALGVVNKKTVWWLHETVAESYVPQYMLEAIDHSEYISIYAVSNLVRSKYQTEFPNKMIKILMYGLPEYQSRNDKKKDKVVFAIIGGLSEEIKGHDVLLNAVTKLDQSDREKAEFWIVGSGRLRDDTMELVRNLDCVSLLGELPHEKIPDLYAQLDVVICASRREALSVVVTEAFMNRKLAIVSSAAGNTDYFVPGEDGLLFPSEDSDELAKLIHWVIMNREKAEKIGKTSRRVYDKYFTMNVFENNLREVLTCQ